MCPLIFRQDTDDIAANVKGLTIDKKLEKIRKILDWLYPDGTSSTHEQLQNDRVANSGKWFMKSDAFKDWAAGLGPTCLVCRGIRLPLLIKYLTFQLGRENLF